MDLSVTVPQSELEAEGFNSFNSFIANFSQSQSSPSPSVASDSSGIGSLVSLKSEADSLPSSPQTTEKKLFEPIEQPHPAEPDYENLKVMYKGRDILDLYANVTSSQWNYRATELPPNNPALFFANRSQYHRLGTYGTRTQYLKDNCRMCGFTWVVVATE